MVDLFAGLGGFSAAAGRVGIKVVLATDVSQTCETIYRANFTAPFVRQDIRQASAPGQPSVSELVTAAQPEIVTAGFPCQSFSRAGRQAGLADPLGRGQLVFDLLNLLRAARPRAFLLENVANLAAHAGGATLGQILQELTSLGYFVTHSVLDAHVISGLPARRERLYIVGVARQEWLERFAWPSAAQKFVGWREILQPPAQIADKYYETGRKLAAHVPGFDWRADTIYTYRRSYVRAAAGGVFPTLMANMGTGGYNVPLVVDKRGLRPLTVRECARLQGLSDDFVLPAELLDKHLYQALGNSISVPTVAAILGGLQAALT